MCKCGVFLDFTGSTVCGRMAVLCPDSLRIYFACGFFFFLVVVFFMDLEVHPCTRGPLAGVKFRPRLK